MNNKTQRLFTSGMAVCVNQHIAKEPTLIFQGKETVVQCFMRKESASLSQILLIHNHRLALQHYVARISKKDVNH